MKRRATLPFVAGLLWVGSLVVILVYALAWASELMIEYLPVPLTIAVFVCLISAIIWDETR
jgi:hypothetical protein